MLVTMLNMAARVCAPRAGGGNPQYRAERHGGRVRSDHSAIDQARSNGWPVRSQPTNLAWLYLLIAVPAATDLIETGRLPQSAREWLTEIVVGAVIAALVHKVRAEHVQLRALSRNDHLTGLLNRASFMESIEDESVRARRSGRPLALVYIDLDNFKLLNDRAGHEAGDRALKCLAAAVREVVRARVDRGFRIGGDEFALLLPESSAEQASGIIARIWQRCVEIDPACFVEPLGISAGIVEMQAHETTAQFVRRADAAMYRQKQQRRAAAQVAARSGGPTTGPH